eukprot:s17_g47.t1
MCSGPGALRSIWLAIWGSGWQKQKAEEEVEQREEGEGDGMREGKEGRKEGRKEGGKEARKELHLCSNLETLTRQATVESDAQLRNFHPVKAMGQGRPQVQFAVVQQSLSSELAVKPIAVARIGDHTQIGMITGSYVVLRPKDLKSTLSQNSLLQSVYVTDPDNYEGSMEVIGRGSFSMTPGQMVKDVPVEIVRQSKVLQEEVVVKMETCEAVINGAGAAPVPMEIGSIHATVVTFVPAYRKGVFSFPFERIAVPGASHSQKLQCIVERLDGCSGPARCNFRTARLSSVPGFDYEETEAQFPTENKENESRARKS